MDKLSGNCPSPVAYRPKESGHSDQVTSEVWWYGRRNPWRFWIDEPSGLTCIADVGQDAFEEISVAMLPERGLNFGWPITRGTALLRTPPGLRSGGSHPTGAGNCPW